jgi:GNAT superfamily N-acetyltransferase
VLVLPTHAASDVRVRLARPDDVPSLARVRAASWHATYRHILPEQELARVTRLRSEERLESALLARRRGVRLLVAERPGAGPIGYAWCGPQTDRRLRGFKGEVFELYLHPQHQRAGVGTLLLSHAMWTMIELDMHPVVIWVLERNPAWHFYESCGGTLVARGSIDFGAHRTTRLAYGWRESLPLPLARMGTP